MYPGTIVNWHDESWIGEQQIEPVDNSPLFLTVSSFNRGPEDLRVVKGKEFYSLYGEKMDFSAHGQPALQAANIINGGGRLLIKRLVAKDANLANVIAVANVRTVYSTVKASEGELKAKTIAEIVGEDPTPVTYADQIDIISEIGTDVGKTKLTVTPAMQEATDKYYWIATDTDVALEKNKRFNLAGYNAWDGSSEIEVPDGTKIRLVEVDQYNYLKAMGVIEVVSALDHPPVSSTSDPDEVLPALYITSEEGSTVGDTNLIVTPVKLDAANVYYYKIFDGSFADPTVSYTDNDMAEWTQWDGASEITIDEGTEIQVVEFSINADDPTAVEYKAWRGAAIVCVTKLPADTRTSTSINLVIPTETKYVVTRANTIVRWDAVSVSNVKTYEEVMDKAARLYKKETPAIDLQDDDSVIITTEVDYPLFAAADNGRGISNKSIKFSPDYSSSKNMKNMFYTITIYDGSKSLEKIIASVDPESVFNNTLYGLNSESSVQVLFGSVPGVYDKYIEDLSKLTGYSKTQLNKYDVLYLTNNRGSVLYPYLALDENSIDFNSPYGVELQGGTNGEFGDIPFGTQAWTDAAIEVLTGAYDDSIWDVDTYKIAAIFDANFPIPVKDECCRFVSFREDCVFFRDFGLGCASYASIVDYYNDILIRDADNEEQEKLYNRFILDYYTTYQIYDPETKIRERVTMMYDFSRSMVNHFAQGPYRPMAGVANNMILDSAIEGTVNFTPRITPAVNQKALLDDLRINYAIFQEGQCVVQSLYTSQHIYTQLSYGNNVLAIQSVIRAIRIACPKQRYTFVTGSDFSSYAQAVNNVLKNFQSTFAELSFGYQQDRLKAAQKIFYASIYFRFNNWAQTEVFDIYALGDA